MLSRSDFRKLILMALLFLFVISCHSIAMAAPKPYGSDVTAEYFIDQHLKGHELNPVEGIWTAHAQGIDADMAIIRNTTGKYTDYEYAGIIINTSSRYWSKGELRLLLQRTSNPNYYKATWLIIGLFWQDYKYASSLILNSRTTFETSLIGEFDSVIRTTGVRLYPSNTVASPAQPAGGSGTGFFIAPRVVITNAHVVNGCTKLTVIYQGKFIRPARLAALDKENDVAILLVDGLETEVRPLFVARSNNVLIGEKAYTLGYPNPDDQGFNAKFTDGIVNSLTGFNDHPRWFQISTPIQPGNSGGPLLDSKGRVIGITSATVNVLHFYKSAGTFPQNVNFAVKSNYILSLMTGLSEGSTLVTNEPTQALEAPQIAELASQAVVFIKSEP